RALFASPDSSGPSGTEGPIFSSHPMSPSILTGRGAPARSLRGKFVNRLRVELFARPQNGVWEIRMIHRVRIVLRLQAHRSIPLIHYAAFALDASIQPVRGIQLHARLRRPHFHPAPRLWIGHFRRPPQLSALPIHVEIDLV